MVRRVFRIAVVAWLVGAGVQWARRHGRSLGPLDRLLHRGAPPKPARKRATGGAKARLTQTASREGASVRSGTSRTTSTETNGAAATATATKAAAAGGAPEAPAADDLKVIEGIGPRFEEVLHGAGVDAFAKLAALDAEAIQAIIRDAGARVPDPTTWPEQARLAAAGEWDALAEMQSHLKGGREVATD